MSRSSTTSRALTIISATVIGISGCNQRASLDNECGGYADWRSSLYVLPYPAGSSFEVTQGNCAAPGNGHRGMNRYAYDFGMEIGTPFVAARDGTVASVEQSNVDGNVAATGHDNYIVIMHDDGTAALYGHIIHHGVTVRVGDQVRQGDLLGRSGNTGNTGNVPHLHFSVHACNPVTGGSKDCPTVPVTFRNTEPNPKGLQAGRTYLAL
jgi:murein DD-endopeptidase MepM/ murein hydrolase activator NlpD